MGEVYRARDTKLGREVAVKVLPDSFARDPERLARFEREARVLASLNHSGIATLHGFENEAGTHFLVMELVPGETLAERFSQGPLSFAEALPSSDRSRKRSKRRMGPESSTATSSQRTSRSRPRARSRSSTSVWPKDSPRKLQPLTSRTRRRSPETRRRRG